MIKNKFTFKQLEAFVAVVDAGSFRRAADVLGTTQPNISNRISTLEEVLNVELLYRDAGSVRLTGRGATLLTATRKVLHAAETLVEEADRRDLIADRLRLGVTELIACTWLHDFLRQMRDHYPAVSIELEVDLSVEIEKKLAAGQCDLALVAGPGKESQTALGLYPYVWVAAPGFEDKVRLEDLDAQTVIAHARHSGATRALFAECEARRVATDRIVCSSSLTSCVQMAVDAMGVALVPRAIASAALAEGMLVEVACDWLPEPLTFHAAFDPERAPGFVRYAADLSAEIAG